MQLPVKKNFFTTILPQTGSQSPSTIRIVEQDTIIIQMCTKYLVNLRRKLVTIWKTQERTLQN